MKNLFQNIIQGIQDIYHILKEIKSLHHQFSVVTVHLQTIIELMESHRQNQQLQHPPIPLPESQPQESQLLDISEVIDLLNISESTYYRWVANGELEPRRKGKRHYYYLSDLQEQLSKGKLRGRL